MGLGRFDDWKKYQMKRGREKQQRKDVEGKEEEEDQGEKSVWSRLSREIEEGVDYTHKDD